MRIYVIIRYTSLGLLLSAALMFISALVGTFYHDNGVYPLFFSALIVALISIFPLIFVPESMDITKTEGLFIVVLSWLMTCTVGTIPYIIWGGEFSMVNAWFESVSGFTTTGSTILRNIEALPPSLLFWRSSTHFIGGIGVVLFALVILPNIGHARFVLVKSEISALAGSSFSHQTKKTVQIILMVYLGLIGGETILLHFLGMTWFDAINHSFATVATGGFSTKNLSIAHFQSTYIELAIMVFMMLSGIHFGLLFSALYSKPSQLFKSEVVRYYVISMLAGIGVVSLSIYLKHHTVFLEALRIASFQVVSLGTTTGFASADSGIWPSLSKLILFFFTLQCACAGSTSGGIKVDRILLFFKTIRLNILKLQHPNAVVSIKLNKQNIDPESLLNINSFILLYVFIVFVSGVILTAFDLDMTTALSASAATIGNVGPGFGMVSSLNNFALLPNAVKYILTLNMLLGRLEIFGLLSIFAFKKWQ